jgi:hypothetical protein
MLTCVENREKRREREEEEEEEKRSDERDERRKTREMTWERRPEREERKNVAQSEPSSPFLLSNVTNTHPAPSHPSDGSLTRPDELGHSTMPNENDIYNQQQVAITDIDQNNAADELGFSTAPFLN